MKTVAELRKEMRKKVEGTSMEQLINIWKLTGKVKGEGVANGEEERMKKLTGVLKIIFQTHLLFKVSVI